MTGETLGHYRIEQKLGEGGMGVVYRAVDIHLDRLVAIKVLHPDAVANPERKRRFVKEAKSASALNHSNIITVYDIDNDRGIDYIAMEYVAGQSLDRSIRPSLSRHDAIAYAVQIAEGLASAHDAGIVHRDLKPANIMVTGKGEIKLVDFGLAKLIEPAEIDELTRTMGPRTETGALIGTAAYMSPEQAQGANVDARSDIFSFGLVFYEMLTGKRAFACATPVETLAAILRDETPATGAGAGFDRVIARCLEKAPARRFQSAHDLVLALHSIVESQVQISTPVSPPATTRIQRRIPLRAAAVLTSVLIAVLVVVGLLAWWKSTRGPTAAERIESIAVLPLHNLSRDPDQEYFTDGMTEALITELAKIKALRVVSRTTVRRYASANKTIPEIAHELNVQAILEGSVERAGDRVRISVHLVRASTEKSIWSESYDRDLRDVLMLQNDVARSIAREIHIEVTPEERARLTSARQVDPTAYAFYLKGRYFWNKRTHDSIHKAIEYFNSAIERAPNYAAAYSGLADCYSSLGFSFDVGDAAPNDVQPKALAAAARAIELDPMLAEAHISLAFIKLNYDWDWQGAEAEFQRGISLNSRWPTGHHWYAHYLLAAGRFREGEDECRRALDLDPLSLILNVHLGWHYAYARQYDQALEQLRKSLDLDSYYGLAYWFRGLAYEQKRMYDDALREMHKAKEFLPANQVIDSDIGHVYAVAGRHDVAKSILRDLERRATQTYVSSFELALIHLGLGENSKGISALEQAYRERSDMLVYLRVDPRLDPVRSIPQFQDLVRRIAIPQ